MVKKVGLIGAGSICSKYLEVLNTIKNANVVSITSRTNSKAKIIKRIYNIKNVYDNHDEMIASENLDLIIVLVSIDQIYNVLKDIIKHRITILVEKPPGLSKTQSQKLFYLSMKFQTQIFVSLNRRFFSNFIKGKKLISQFGGVKNIIIEGHERIWNVKNRSKYVKDHWIYANSIHTIDLLRFFGGEVKSVINISKSKNKKNKQNFLSLIKFKNGATGSYFSNWHAPGGWSVKLYCDGLTIVFEPLENGYYMKKNMVKRPINFDKKDIQFKPGFHRQIDLIIKYLENGKISRELQTIFSAHKTMELISKINY